MLEIIVARQLGLHRKPIVLLNLDDYYTPLLAMFDRGVDRHFVRAEVRTIIQVATTVESAIALLAAADLSVGAAS